MADDSYDISYDDITIHELMLKDKPRTLAYKTFIENNAHLFRRKVVVDVGAGTGILSLFTAKAGAKKVYAVEVSNISRVCRKVVEKNKMGNIIQVIQGKVEDVNIPERADVIISEWMGFYLLHESMLDSIISARDKFLKPDGLILPSRANLYACPTSMRSHYKEVNDFWKNLYDFDLSPVADEILNPSSAAVGNFTKISDDGISKMEETAKHLSMTPTKEPKILSLQPIDLLCNPHLVTAIDLLYADTNDFDRISTSLTFDFAKHDIFRGIALWFDVTFTNPDEEDEDNDHGTRTSTSSILPTTSTTTTTTCTLKSKVDTSKIISPSGTSLGSTASRPIILSTSPNDPPTHWKQTVVPFSESYFVNPGSKFKCDLTLMKDKVNRRRYNITVEVEGGDDEDEEEEEMEGGGGDIDEEVRAELEELVKSKMIG